MNNGQLPSKIIVCIDLKSFFASVSSVIRGLDPLKTKLTVVGDTKWLGFVVLVATPLSKKEGIVKINFLNWLTQKRDTYYHV
ncbi:hypothetical protein ACTL7R_01915 [Priestia aryabhattai]|uniref:hypothetical protein n=1 Tax=Priestia TaxID=2800373 RepID=UPI003F8A73D5